MKVGLDAKLFLDGKWKTGSSAVRIDVVTYDDLQFLYLDNEAVQLFCWRVLAGIPHGNIPKLCCPNCEGHSMMRVPK